MNKLECMKVFETIAEQGSLSKASKKLGLPLPTVSRRLTELEEELGVTLAIRSTRSFDLTEVGLTYLSSIKELLNQIEEVESRLHGSLNELKGHIVLTASVCFGKHYVLPHLTQFLKENPHITVQLLLCDNPLDLVDQHIDIAIRLGNLPDSTLMATHLGEVRRCTIASPRYLKKYGTPKDPNELSKHRCISIDNINASQSWTFFRGNKKKTISVNTQLSVNNVEAGIETIREGMGIGQAFSYQIKKDLSQKNLKIILEKNEPPNVPIHLIYHGGQKISHRLRVLIDFLSPKLRADLK